MFELVELRQESVDHLESITFISSVQTRLRKLEQLTRRASDGSLPDIAPARAAVRLSTSSVRWEYCLNQLRPVSK